MSVPFEAVPPEAAVSAAPVVGRQRHPFGLLACVVGGQVMVVIATTAVSLALIGIRKDLHFSQENLSWVVNAYVLTLGSLLLLGGRAGDIFGRRRMFLTGVATFTVGALLATVSPSAPVLLIGQALQGLGAALAEPTSLALVATTFAQGRPRNLALGVFSTVAGVGTAVGLILGGALSDSSWRWILFVNVPIGLVVLVAAVFLVDESPRAHRDLDLPGAVLSTAALLALVYSLARALHDVGLNRTSTLILIAAIILGIAFLFVERRAAQPVVPLSLFRNRNRSAALVGTLLVGATVAGLFYFMTQFFTVVLRYSGVAAGVAYVPLAAMMIVGGLAAPRILHTVRPKTLTLVGMLFLTAGVIWLSRISMSSTYTGAALLPLLLIGVGLGLTIMPLNSILLTDVLHAQAGAASALQQMMLRIGASIGLVIMVAAGTKHASHEAGKKALPTPAGVAHAVSRAFECATVFIVLALIISAILLHSARPDVDEEPVADNRATPIDEQSMVRGS